MKHRSKRLLDRVRDAIRLKGYSVRTEEAYADWIKRFMESSGRKPRRLRRGGRPVPRTREQQFADDSGKRRLGGVNVSCYNNCRESKAGSSHGLSVGLSLCLDSPVPPQGTDGGCGAAVGGIDPRDLRSAGLGSGGIDGVVGSCTPVCQLSASGCACEGDECAEEYHGAGVVR